MMFTQLTEAHHDNFVMYQVQGMTLAQIELMQNGLFTGNWLGWFTTLATPPFLGFIKEYLQKG